MTAESPAHRGAVDALAADIRAQRKAALHALNVLEYALAAPEPRRRRTWFHRVTAAIDALHTALHAQLPSATDPISVLDEIALANPDCILRIRRIQQELLDLTIALASLREQVEPDPMLEIDPTDIRDQLGALTRRFRQHQTREADLVDEAIGRQIDEPPTDRPDSGSQAL
ncbi:MAG: hypothetical protein ABIP17_17370 [Ilumatobacteraceae bacterium]